MGDSTATLAAGTSETSIDVDLAERRYAIVIGEDLISSAGSRLKALLPRARFAVVSDANVAGLHLAPLKASLEQEGLFLGSAVVAPGEASKSFPVLEKLCETLLELDVERSDCVIALGGGWMRCAYSSALMRWSGSQKGRPSTIGREWSSPCSETSAWIA